MTVILDAHLLHCVFQANISSDVSKKVQSICTEKTWLPQAELVCTHPSCQRTIIIAPVKKEQSNMWSYQIKFQLIVGIKLKATPNASNTMTTNKIPNITISIGTTFPKKRESSDIRRSCCLLLFGILLVLN